MEKPSWGLQTIHNLFGDFTLCVHSKYERSIMSKHSCWVAVFPDSPTNSAAPDPKMGMQTFLPPCRLYISNQSLERHLRYSSREENSARPYLSNAAAYALNKCKAEARSIQSFRFCSRIRHRLSRSQSRGSSQRFREARCRGNCLRHRKRASRTPCRPQKRHRNRSGS